MLSSTRSLLSAAVLVVSAVAGCSQPKESPVISSIEGSRSVEARDSVDYACHASDPDLKQLSYSWSGEGGRLGWDWGKDVRWFAPDSSGRAVVRVTVTDEDGLTANDSLAITVRAETAGVLFWDAAVKVGDFQVWSDTVRAGYRLYGYWISDPGSIYFMVMDDSNYAKWVAGGAAVPLLRLPDTINTFSVLIPVLGVYHLIVDNRQGVEDYGYSLSVWKTGP